MSFDFLGLSDELLKAVQDAGYTEPTPIQQQAIPSILQGRDVLGIAQTGTGKTAGFTLPMIDILAEGRSRARIPRTLILEPTRELAAQVEESFEKYGKYHKLTQALIIGGVSFEGQEKALDRGVDVLIATPGRLIDHFERGRVMLTGVEILVIDEADRMLDMGFIPDVEKIRSFMPKKPQTLFFSATMPPPIKRLSERFLDNPKLIEVARPATKAENIEEGMVIVPDRDKRKALRTLIEAEKIKNAILFCNRKKDVKIVCKSLRAHGYSTEQLHGDMTQHERMEVLQAFKDDKIRILCASDVAARGLDIPDVSHIFNFDVPEHAEDYVHRIGRTGRAGKKGRAITIAKPKDGRYISAIENLTGCKIPKLDLANLGQNDFAEDDEPSGSGGRGRGHGRGRGRGQGRRPDAKRPQHNRQPQSKPKDKVTPPPREAAAKKPVEATATRKPAKQTPAPKPRTAKPVQPASTKSGWTGHMPAFLGQPPKSTKK